MIVDPSHAAGRRELVRPLSLAAVAAGADGLIVEVHPEPEVALCDGPQALTTAEFAGTRTTCASLARAPCGRASSPPHELSPPGGRCSPASG